MNPSSSFPHPVYAQTVLRENFEDAQRWFLEPLLELHQAHALMLSECGILPHEEVVELLGAIRALRPEEIRAVEYDGSCEDLFFYVEGLLAKASGAEVAGKLHTARSRNDIDITLYRMVLRQRVLELLDAVLQLAEQVHRMAQDHAESLMPAYTHTQPAQPTTLGHYLAGVAECLQRDAQRLRAAYRTVNRNPLGACAITTTGFPIDRQRTAQLLGFDGLQENSIGAIAAVDYVAETLSAIAVTALNCGKFTQDLLLWCSQEFGFLRVGDAWAQISSIMPQKRNPVAFEHARVMLSRAFAQSQAAIVCCHNTPFGDIVDSEDDLWPAVFRATGDADRALQLLCAALRDVEVNAGRMAELAGRRFVTVTELADRMVRDGGLSFREAHQLVAQAVRLCGQDDSAEAILQALHRSAAEMSSLPLSDAAILEALDPRAFVAVRLVAGGPAPTVLRDALGRLQQECDAHRQWLGRQQEALAAAAKTLAATMPAVV
jgi:argininosuccinate lyase